MATNLMSGSDSAQDRCRSGGDAGGAGDRAVAYALDQLAAGTLELPPECSVTYDLEAIDILRSLLRPVPAGDQLRVYYEDFWERNGARPLAAEANNSVLAS